VNHIHSPDTTDPGIEREIIAKGLTAPRVTPADLEAAIAHTEYVKHVSYSGQVLRWAVLTTHNGYAVTGRPSVAVSPSNDDEEIGCKVARENAKQELWPLTITYVWGPGMVNLRYLDHTGAEHVAFSIPLRTYRSDDKHVKPSAHACAVRRASWTVTPPCSKSASRRSRPDRPPCEAWLGHLPTLSPCAVKVGVLSVDSPRVVYALF
jgi:hypothetical protein